MSYIYNTPPSFWIKYFDYLLIELKYPLAELTLETVSIELEKYNAKLIGVAQIEFENEEDLIVFKLKWS